MAAPRSVYSWDIYIQKFDGKVSKRHQVLSISDFSLWLAHCRSLRDLHSCAHTHTRTHTQVFLDKRDGASLDYLTVSETAREPPTASEGVEDYNHPER